MQYIVLNLEYNNLMINDMGNTKRDTISEIIELGAIKLDKSFNIIDDFKVLVKPIIHNRIDKRIVNTTNLNMNILKNGADFKTAIEYFIEWADEDFILCLWSTNDINVLISNFKYFNIDINTNEWFSNFIDVQYEASNYFNSNEQLSST